MSDWESKLTPAHRAQWDEFVEHFRRDALQKIAGSGAFISLLPEGDFDVKFAVELGAAIMMDKPIMVVASPGREVPRRLAELADVVVTVDVDTEEGREALSAALRDWGAFDRGKEPG